MNQPKLCECGCGEEIPWRPHHKSRPPKYLRGHFSRAQGHPNAYVPSPEEIPSGLCECGCGLRTNISPTTNRRRRWFKGHPQPRLPAHGEHKRGADSPRWKGGRILRRGYVLLHMPDHPRADSKGYIPEHQVVACGVRGYDLEPGETVHHINGVKDDNRPENLRILKRSEHQLAHSLEISERMRRFHAENPDHASKAGKRSAAVNDMAATGRKGAEARWGKKP